jgi:hypothetical protein
MILVGLPGDMENTVVPHVNDTRCAVTVLENLNYSYCPTDNMSRRAATPMRSAHSTASPYEAMATSQHVCICSHDFKF